MFSDFNLEKYKRTTFPPDHSLKTLNEIKQLINKPVDISYSQKYDDVKSSFERLFKNRTRKFPEKLVDDLLEHSRPIILKLKNYHNRKRPNEVAKDFNINLSYNYMKSAQTPAFPSGHSTQSKLIGLVLSDLYPEMRQEFMQTAEHVSQSRIAARVHYESDKKVGESLGESLYQHFKSA